MFILPLKAWTKVVIDEIPALSYCSAVTLSSTQLRAHREAERIHKRVFWARFRCEPAAAAALIDIRGQFSGKNGWKSKIRWEQRRTSTQREMDEGGRGRGLSSSTGEEWMWRRGRQDGEMEELKRWDEKKAADALCLSDETRCFHQITWSIFSRIPEPVCSPPLIRVESLHPCRWNTPHRRQKLQFSFIRWILEAKEAKKQESKQRSRFHRFGWRDETHLFPFWMFG